MSVEKEIQAYVLAGLKTQNTIYEPTTFDIMCFYTKQGVCGPTPYEPNSFYSTFSTQSQINDAKVFDSASFCIDKIQQKINVAKEEVAKAANNELSFVHVRFFGVRARICRSFVIVSADVCVACTYKNIGMLDTMFDFET